MVLAKRIRKIREMCGWKQTAVAQALNITQQGYSSLETGGDNAKLNTLKRFCATMGVTLEFLVSDIDVTEENIQRFGKRTFHDIALEDAKLRAKVQAYEELISKK